MYLAYALKHCIGFLVEDATQCRRMRLQGLEEIRSCALLGGHGFECGKYTVVMVFVRARETVKANFSCRVTISRWS